MKNIFISIGKSVYGPAYYAELKTRSFGLSLGYYLKFALICSLVITVIWSFQAIPLITALTSNIDSRIAEYYPADLVVALKDGKVSINQPEPYRVPFLSDDSSVRYLVTIDTKTPFSLEKFNSYESLIWITKDSVVSRRSRDTREVTVSPLAGIPNYVLDQAKIKSYSGAIIKIAGGLRYLVVPVLFTASLFVFVYRMAYLLIAALVIWLLSAIFKLGLPNYGKAYQAGLHAMTLPFLLTGLFSVFPVMLLFQPRFMFSIVMLIVVVVNLIGAKKSISTASFQ